MNESQSDEKETDGGSQHPFNALSYRFPSDNLGVLSHFYRGELARAMAWRQKMDATTHWAILASTALVSVAFTSEARNTLILPAASAFLFLLLNLEGRRFRHFDVWRTRVRMLEVHLLTPAIAHHHPIREGNWREMLVRDLFRPSYKLSYWEAVGRRLWRTYIWLFALVLVAWLVEIQVKRNPEQSYFEAAAVRRVDGSVAVPAYLVIGVMTLLYSTLLAILLQTRGVNEATGEVRGRDPERQNWPI